ncbi:MAG: GNAT family N-acetyltransferase [Chloroflexi bacterium]|nr:GNAT family N-acetyltransferase [Chloroflexota bacterium]
MPFVIRPAVIEDYESICTILEEADAIHHAAEPDYFRPSSESRRPRILIEQQLTSDSAAIYVAEEFERVIGVLFLVVRTIPDVAVLRQRCYAMVDMIAVKESWRSQGVGHALLAQAEIWAKSKGLDHIELQVWEFNQRALALYEKMGYRTLRRSMSKIV